MEACAISRLRDHRLVPIPGIMSAQVRISAALMDPYANATTITTPNVNRSTLRLHRQPTLHLHRQPTLRLHRQPPPRMGRRAPVPMTISQRPQKPQRSQIPQRPQRPPPRLLHSHPHRLYLPLPRRAVRVMACFRFSMPRLVVLVPRLAPKVVMDRRSPVPGRQRLDIPSLVLSYYRLSLD